MGNSKSKHNSERSGDSDGNRGKKKFNISECVIDNMNIDESSCDQAGDALPTSESLRKHAQRTFVSFIYHRASNLFVDDDDLEGHEFYEETRKRSSGKWILKRVARRHLRHCEFQKLAKPFIHLDCPVVILSDSDMQQLSAS